MTDLEPVKYVVNCHALRNHIYLESRGKGGWVVTDGSGVLNSDGEFEYEPLPSNRDDEFIARTRFKTIEGALANFQKHLPQLAERGF
jgi:hypothetical protein